MNFPIFLLINGFQINFPKKNGLIRNNFSFKSKSYEKKNRVITCDHEIFFFRFHVVILFSLQFDYIPNSRNI